MTQDNKRLISASQFSIENNSKNNSSELSEMHQSKPKHVTHFLNGALKQIELHSKEDVSYVSN